MRYDKHNQKLDTLKSEIENLKKTKLHLEEENHNIKEILNDTLHEVRRFSAQLTKFSERLSRDTEDKPKIQQTALSIFYTAGMISSRLAYTDLELNPRAIESQTTVRSGVYKKFDKAKRILSEEARDRKVTIKLEGESRFEIDALPVFELLPFVLFENAIKYSPENQSVTALFDTTGGRLTVTITSLGPIVDENDELPRIFEKGFRGKHTKGFPGEGRGLFLAKQVCQFHDIRVKAEKPSKDPFHINGTPFCEFRIILDF